MWFFRFAVVFFGSGAVIGAAAIVTDHHSVGTGLLAILVFGGLATLGWSLLSRANDQIAVSGEGIWRLPQKAVPTFIAWADVVTVRADDVAQRLIVSDRSRTIRLDYHLNEFFNLRDYVLVHTSPESQSGPVGASIFHRSMINRCVYLVFLSCFVIIAWMSFSQGQPAPAIVFLIFGALQLIVIAQDPLSLVVRQGAVIITYPGWKREIPFSDITSVTQGEDASEGNVWAAVTINLKGRKPIKLYRFREGSLALSRALQGALGTFPAHAATSDLR